MRWWGKRESPEDGTPSTGSARASADRAVAAGGDIGIAVTGDHNRIVFAPAVRSAYREQVHRIAPDELVHRETELAELAAFCTAESGPAYAWWRAEAWAGKTALLSWFALHPPPDIRVVSFFITAGLGVQNDTTAYVDVVLEQLAELTGEGLPTQLTPATREAHLLHLYGAAAASCARRGERLVLLVDGLDEDRGVTTGPDAHSIASLLPARPDDGMRVLVTGRLNPPLPGDVPDRHPLHDPGIVRTLTPSPYAQVIRQEAERELKRLIEAGGLEYDLLALVTAAGGGLTAEDLAALTGAVPYRVRDVLRTRAGRTFALRVDVYLLAHEKLQAQAVEMLGPAELDRHRGRLHDWVEEWRARGWPDGTPEYLLRGYFRLLRTEGDLRRMVECAFDEARHDRMLEMTGGDAAALTETGITEELLIEDGAPDLTDAVRLALHRENLEGRNSRLTRVLPRAWAALGRQDRAEALARSIPKPAERMLALADIATALVDRGERAAAVRLLDGMEPGLDWDRAMATADGKQVPPAVIRAWMHAGLPDRAESLMHRSGDLSADLVVEWAESSGNLDRAEPLCLGQRHLAGRARAAAEVAALWVEAGRLDRAEDLARRAGPEAEPVVLTRIAAALRRDGREEEAAGRLARVDASTCDPALLALLVTALTTAGEYDRAVAVTRFREEEQRHHDHWGYEDDWGYGDRTRALCGIVWALAADGEHARARSLAEEIEDSDFGPRAWGGLARVFVDSGDYAQVERLIDEARSDSAREWARYALVHALTETGDLDRAETLARAGAHDPFHSNTLRLIVKARARTGELERARELARSLGSAEDYEALVDGAVAAATAGFDSERVARLVADRETEIRRPSRSGSLGRVETAVVLAAAGWTDEAAAVLEDVEIPVVHGPGPRDTSTNSTLEFWAQDVVRALAWTGRFDEAEELARRLQGGYAAPSAGAVLAERLCAAGQFGRVADFAAESDAETQDSVRMVLATHTVAAGDKATAFALAAGLVDPDLRTRAWARIAVVLAGAGDEEGAERALGEAESHRPDWPDDLAAADLLHACLALRRYEEGDALLGRLALVPPPGVLQHVMDILVERGECARARSVIDEYILDPADVQATLVHSLVTAGHHSRAAELVRGIEESGADPDARLWVAVAPAVEPAHGRVLLARALRHMRLQNALPTLIRVDPGTIPLIVDTLRDTR